MLKTWDMSIVKQVPWPAGSGAVQRRVPERVQPGVFNNANTDPTNANFGKVTSQNNLPRDIQLAARSSSRQGKLNGPDKHGHFFTRARGFIHGPAL